MATKRKLIEVYYNVDHNYWSNSKGDYLPAGGIPRVAFGLLALLKLHLIHADGSAVTDFDASHVPHFTVFDETGVAVIDSNTFAINTDEAKLLWNADVTKGEFAILLSCTSVQLHDALVGFSCKRMQAEFIVSSAEGMVGEYDSILFCDATNLADIAEVDAVTAMQKTGTVNVGVNDAFSLIEADNTLYAVSAAILEAPADATESYSVTSVEPTETGFKVFYNAIILTVGYILRYTLTLKG